MAWKEKTAGQLADQVLLRCKLASLSSEELSELAEDLQTQMGVHGDEAAQTALPHPALRGILEDAKKDNRRKTLAGLGGGALGGLAGGAGGALLAAITRGKEYALPAGILGTIPGSIGGYLFGKHLQQRQDIAGLIREKL